MNYNWQAYPSILIYLKKLMIASFGMGNLLNINVSKCLNFIFDTTKKLIKTTNYPQGGLTLIDLNKYNKTKEH